MTYTVKLILDRKPEMEELIELRNSLPIELFSDNADGKISLSYFKDEARIQRVKHDE